MSHQSPRRPGWRGARPGCQHHSDHGARAEQLPRGQTCRTCGSVPELPHGAASAVLPQTARAPPVPRSCEPLPDTGPQAPSNGDTWPPDAESPLRPRMLPVGAPPAARRRPLSILCSSRVLFTGLSCSSSPIRSAFLFRSNAPACCSRAARRARPVPLIRVCRRRGAAEPRASSPGASSLRSGSPFPLRPGPQRFDRFYCSFDVF